EREPGDRPVSDPGELWAVSAALEAAREQQAATAEILRLIASSPDDAQPVFDASARHALRLCRGLSCLVTRRDGHLVRLAATPNVLPERVASVEAFFPRALDRTFPVGLAIADRRIVHVPDLESTSEVTSANPRAGSLVAVPLMLHGDPLGAIGVWRPATGP